MIEVRLFGDLRRYAPGLDSGGRLAPSGVAVQVSTGEAGTVGQVLAALGIDPAEVGNLFLNGRLVPRSAQAIHLGYSLAKAVPLSPEASLDVSVEEGDRLGIFARKMCLLVV
jgi:hypothetical protein